MRRKPNQYGTVKKLSGNRLRPFAACKPAVRDLNKCYYKQEIIGYYETEQEALQALSDWNKSRGSKTNFTFEDLYNEWSRKNYPKLSKSTVDCYKAAFGHLTPLHSKKVKDLRTIHFQEIIDDIAADLSWSSVHKVKVLIGLIEQYAMQYDVTEKNYAEFIEIPPKPTDEKMPFSEEQVAVIEAAAAKNFMWSRVIVILIHTGWRISELLDLTVEDYNPADLTLIGGNKTENGKNRTVPVQLIIKTYLDEYASLSGPRLICRTDNGNNQGKLVPITPNYFRANCFKPTLDALGIHKPDGSDFTPHATRHTFASLANKAGMNPLVLKKIIGHSPKADVTEKVYIHIDDEQLREGMNLFDKIG